MSAATTMTFPPRRRERQPYEPPSVTRITTRRPDGARFTVLPRGEGARPCSAIDLHGRSVCPNQLCVDAANLAIKRAHERAVKRSRLHRADDANPWRSGRSRSTKTEPKRVVRPIAGVETDLILAVLLAHLPLRRGVDRREMLSETWLELVNPSVRVVKPGMPLGKRLEGAIQRAQSQLRKK